LAFVDRAGTNWLRKGDGRLSKIPREPVTFYGLPEPVAWDIPSDSPPTQSEA
jgi:hypothetical protein